MRRFGGLNCHLRDCRHGGSLFLKSASPSLGAAPFSPINTAVLGTNPVPASEDTSVSLVHWQEPYSHRGRVLADCSQLPGLRRLVHLPGASRTIDFGSSPAPFKRLRPFKESAAPSSS